jgi:hypothetical protein
MCFFLLRFAGKNCFYNKETTTIKNAAYVIVFTIILPGRSIITK